MFVVVINVTVADVVAAVVVDVAVPVAAFSVVFV